MSIQNGSERHITHFKTKDGQTPGLIAMINHLNKGHRVRSKHENGPLLEVVNNEYVRSDPNGSKADNLLSLPRF